MSDVDDSIGHRFIVGSAIGGVHSMTGNRLAQGFECGVLVMEELDENML